MPDIDSAAIQAAAAILRAGGLVAFPTETVYGLGADATNPAAVDRIYRAKGRPAGNPLIVHVSDQAMAKCFAASWPAAAQQLADAFWPGPLTIVVPRGPAIAPQVSAGLSTIGMRAPDHLLAQALLREFDGPVAAPSANRSNRISPTTADHVRAELGDAADAILDGGPCQIGIESTVVDVSGPGARVLRPGSIGAERIARVIGEVDSPPQQFAASKVARSPGQQPVHYAPRTPAYRFIADQTAEVLKWSFSNWQLHCALMVREDSPAAGQLLTKLAAAHRLIAMPNDADAYARIFYATLHQLDAANLAAIWIELPPNESAWVAIRDRVMRATSCRIA